MICGGSGPRSSMSCVRESASVVRQKAAGPARSDHIRPAAFSDAMQNPSSDVLPDAPIIPTGVSGDSEALISTYEAPPCHVCCAGGGRQGGSVVAAQTQISAPPSACVQVHLAHIDLQAKLEAASFVRRRPSLLGDRDGRGGGRCAAGSHVGERGEGDHDSGLCGAIAGRVDAGRGGGACAAKGDAGCKLLQATSTGSMSSSAAVSTEVKEKVEENTAVPMETEEEEEQT